MILGFTDYSNLLTYEFIEILMYLSGFVDLLFSIIYPNCTIH